MEYYDEFIKKDGDDLCKICGEKTYYSKDLKKYSPLCKKHFRGVSLEKLTIKYGDDGKRRFEEYRQKQAISNTYEYKQEKHGWTEEQFNEFNMSRAITKDNMIKKYGYEEGIVKYNEYCEKQKDSGCSLVYFQNKYGEEQGLEKYKEVNLKKSHTLESYINRYGDEELAKIKLEEFYETKNYGYASRMSQELFDELYIRYNKPVGIYYRDLNKEFGKMNHDGRYFFYDFVDTISKTVIEFNGLHFHVKDENLEFTQLFSGKSKEEVIEHDKTKQTLIESFGYYVHYVWEDDYCENKELIIEQCLELLRSRNDNN